MTWILISALFACGDKNTIDTADSNTDTNTGTEDSGENQTTDTETPIESNPGETSNDDDGDDYPDEEDCDDTDPNTHPDAIDFPGDNIDQNCDGSEPALEDAGRPLANPNFEQTTNGQPSDWSDLGDALLWQEHGSEISNANGGTGITFSAFEGIGSLKLWGDYGADPYGRGESSVYQQFLSTDQWTPANHVFWIDAWAMIHDTDPLQNGAKFSIGIRCINDYAGTRTVVAESFSSSFISTSPTNLWTRLWASVECPSSTTMTQAIFLFQQSTPGPDSPDHGAVFIDAARMGVIP